MLPSVFVFAAFLRTGAGLIRLVPLGECEQRVRCLIKVDGPRATDDKVAQSNNDNENESYTGHEEQSESGDCSTDQTGNFTRPKLLPSAGQTLIRIVQHGCVRLVFGISADVQYKRQQRCKKFEIYGCLLGGEKYIAERAPYAVSQSAGSGQAVVRDLPGEDKQYGAIHRPNHGACGALDEICVRNIRKRSHYGEKDGKGQEGEVQTAQHPKALAQKGCALRNLIGWKLGLPKTRRLGLLQILFCHRISPFAKYRGYDCHGHTKHTGLAAGGANARAFFSFWAEILQILTEIKNIFTSKRRKCLTSL